ncbi:MAG TPA: HAD hydrolase-like protein [Candidatus Saccharimonadales bacterium]|nr:HAD hydrolase-like protein [Candidatus Saccharimonadales bacterium]
MATIIFDFDGTLADTFALVVDVSYELTGVPRLPAEKLERLRAVPILQAVQALGAPRWLLWRQILQTRARMLPRMHTVQAFSGIPELLHALHSAGNRLYVVSSNQEQNVRAFLKARKLEAYIDGVGEVLYSNVFYKVRGLKKLVRRMHQAPADCVYVGNEAVDVLAAKRAGMRAIGVTWSGQHKASLQTANPDAIVNTPKELLKTLDK